jgi:hypothetical protein
MSNSLLMPQPHQCDYCGKKFSQPKTLVSHLCEKKRRAFQEKEKRVQAGFSAFIRFWQLTNNSKKKILYKDFCDSPYYNAFVKFGSFVNNVNPIYPDRFVDYVIKSGVKLDHWCRDELYEKYLFEMIKIEPVESAVQRTLQTMMEWGDEHKAEFAHYFNYVSLNKAVHDILHGRISPWMVLNSAVGQSMVRKMSDDQLNMIAPAFDVPFWMKKFRETPADVALVKEICHEVGIK